MTSLLCAHVYTSMHACICNYVHECAHAHKGQETTSSVLPQGPATFFCFCSGTFSGLELAK